MLVIPVNAPPCRHWPSEEAIYMVRVESQAFLDLCSGYIHCTNNQYKGIVWHLNENFLFC